MGLLKDGGYVTANSDGHLALTDLGREVAEKTYERHTSLKYRILSVLDNVSIEET